MRFERPLLFGTLIRRYQRFFAEIELESPPVYEGTKEGGSSLISHSSSLIVAHCPNTGSMKGVNVPGARVAVSQYPDDPARRMKFCWQMIHLDGAWIGINTMVPNKIAAEAFEAGLIPRFRKYSCYQSEVKVSSDSRIDFALGQRNQRLVEVKNVTLVENGLAKFPDCVSERATKHLHRLIEHIAAGGTSSLLFVIQHHAASAFAPADDLDPVYGKTLRKALQKGVTIEAWKAKVTTEEILLSEKVKVCL